MRAGQQNFFTFLLTQIIAGQSRGVTVDLLVVGLGGYDFGNGGAVCGDDAGEIHHFGQTLHSGVLEKAVDIPIIQVGATFIQGGGGHAGGDHKPYIHRQIFCGGKHIVDAVGAHDIGDLMGIGDDGGSAVGQHSPGEFIRTYQAGFQVVYL